MTGAPWTPLLFLLNMPDFMAFLSDTVTTPRKHGRVPCLMCLLQDRLLWCQLHRPKTEPNWCYLDPHILTHWHNKMHFVELVFPSFDLNTNELCSKMFICLHGITGSGKGLAPYKQQTYDAPALSCICASPDLNVFNSIKRMPEFVLFWYGHVIGSRWFK